jgi:hypothetical protein
MSNFYPYYGLWFAPPYFRLNSSYWSQQLLNTEELRTRFVTICFDMWLAHIVFQIWIYTYLMITFSVKKNYQKFGMIVIIKLYGFLNIWSQNWHDPAYKIRKNHQHNFTSIFRFHEKKERFTNDKHETIYKRPQLLCLKEGTRATLFVIQFLKS